MQKTCGRLSPAVRLYAANFTVRVITMCQRDTSDHDGQPEKTRRCARGLVGRRHLVRQRTAKPCMAGEALPRLWLVVQPEHPRRDGSLGSRLRSKQWCTTVRPGRETPALTRAAPRKSTIRTDKELKPKPDARTDGGRPAERRAAHAARIRRGPASPANADAERVESRRIQASAGLGTASAVLTTYQVRHVRREPTGDRARAVLRRGAVEAVEEIATTAATTI